MEIALLLLVPIAIIVLIILGVVAFARTGYNYRRLEELQRELRRLGREVTRLSRTVNEFTSNKTSQNDAQESETPEYTLLDDEDEEPSSASPAPQPPQPARPAPPQKISPTRPSLQAMYAKGEKTPDVPSESRPEKAPEKTPEESAPVPAGPIEAPPDLEGLPVTQAPKSDKLAALEERIGKNWMIWAGAIILICGAGFLIRYAYAEGYISPLAQVSLIAVAAFGLIAGGYVFMQREMFAFGQGLAGLGLTGLYLDVFSAFRLYQIPLIGQSAAFGLMAAVTVGGVWFAVWRNAQIFSMIAVLGGFLTPVLVATGAPPPQAALFGYILFLNLGVLTVGFFRQWRLPGVLAFFGTVVIFGGWCWKFYAPELQTPTLLWLGTFALIFLLLPFLYHIRARTPVQGQSFAMEMLNAAVAFGAAWWMLQDEPHILALIALVAALVYAVLGGCLRIRLPEDARSLFGFAVLAMLFFLLAPPLYFELDGLTLSWAGQALVLVGLGYRFQYRLIRWGGAVAVVMVAVRTFMVHQPAYVTGTSPFVSRSFILALAAPVSAALFAAIHQIYHEKADKDDTGVKRFAAAGAGMLLLAHTHIFLQSWLAASASAMGIPRTYLIGSALTALWGAGVAGYFAANLKYRSGLLSAMGWVSLLLSIGYGVFSYTGSAPAGMSPFINSRFAAALLPCIATILLSELNRREFWSPVAGIAGGYAFLLALQMESLRGLAKLATSLAWHSDYVIAAGLSLLWTLGSIAFIGWGKKRERAWPRVAGMVTLLPALGFVVFGFFAGKLGTHPVFFNLRYLAGFGVCATLFLHAYATRNAVLKMLISIFAGFMALILNHLELEGWLTSASEGNSFSLTAGSALILLWTAGAIAFLSAGLRYRIQPPRYTGLVPLAVAMYYAVRLYTLPFADGMIVFLNFRFLAAVVAVIGTFAFSHIFRHCQHTEDEGDIAWQRSFGAFLAGAGLLSLWVLLSIEVWYYAQGLSESSDTIRQLRLISVSIIWGVYGVGLIAVGFWRRWRAVRLTGLCVIGLTLPKLVIFDLADIAEIYRIILFFALGFFMIGVSYLYHWVEKRVQKQNNDYAEKEDSLRQETSASEERK